MSSATQAAHASRKTARERRYGGEPSIDSQSYQQRLSLSFTAMRLLLTPETTRRWKASLGHPPLSCRTTRTSDADRTKNMGQDAGQNADTRMKGTKRRTKRETERMTKRSKTRKRKKRRGKGWEEDEVFMFERRGRQQWHVMVLDGLMTRGDTIVTRARWMWRRAAGEASTG